MRGGVIGAEDADLGLQVGQYGSGGAGEGCDLKVDPGADEVDLVAAAAAAWTGYLHRRADISLKADKDAGALPADRGNLGIGADSGVSPGYHSLESRHKVGGQSADPLECQLPETGDQR